MAVGPGDVRRLLLDVHVAAAPRSRRTTSGIGSPTCSRRSSARRCRCAARIARDPRRGAGGAARRGRRHARRRRAQRTGHRTPRLDARPASADAQRPLPASRALRRARASGRGAGRARRSRSPRPRTRAAPCRALINGRRRHLQIVGIALSPEYVYTVRPGRAHPRREALRRLLDGPPGPRRGLRHGGRLQRRRADAGARRQRAGRDRRARPPAAAVRRARRHSAQPADLELVAQQRTGAAARLRPARPDDLPRRGGVPAQRRADAHRLGAARADRGAQGARLQQRRDRPALREVGPRGRGRRQRGGRSWRAPGWDAASSACTTTSSASRCCSTGCRQASRCSGWRSASSSAVAGAVGAVRRAVRLPPAEAMRPEPPARFTHQRRRAHRPAPVPRAGRPHGRPAHRAPAGARGHVHPRHRVVGGHAGARLVLHRRDGRDVARAVRPRAAAGRHRRLRRAADLRRPSTPCGACPACWPWSRSAACPSACARDTCRASWSSPGMPDDPRLQRVVDLVGQAVALPSAGLVLSGALADGASASARDRWSTSRCSKGAA